MEIKKLFVLGLPGSGKSSVARFISMFAKDRQSPTTHVNDYDILYQMFQEDTQGQFRSAAYGGFDVLDLSVFDTALRKLEQKVRTHVSRVTREEIVLIEFSRNDYKKAFQQFSQEFLQDAYFLYLSVDLGNCKSRIRERIAHPATLDDHFVSEYIFDAYYNSDNGKYLPNILERDYEIDKYRVLVIDNNCSLEVASRKIDFFIDFICPLAALNNTTVLSLGVPEETQPKDKVNSSICYSGELKLDDKIGSPEVLVAGSVIRNF